MKSLSRSTARIADVSSIAGVRFGHSTTRRRGARRPPPREDPAQARHALAGGLDNRTTGSGTVNLVDPAALAPTDRGE
jgi:hypothetical protein